MGRTSVQGHDDLFLRKMKSAAEQSLAKLNARVAASVAVSAATVSRYGAAADDDDDAADHGGPSSSRAPGAVADSHEGGSGLAALMHRDMVDYTEWYSREVKEEEDGDDVNADEGGSSPYRRAQEAAREREREAARHAYTFEQLVQDMQEEEDEDFVHAMDLLIRVSLVCG